MGTVLMANNTVHDAHWRHWRSSVTSLNLTSFDGVQNYYKHKDSRTIHCIQMELLHSRFRDLSPQCFLIERNLDRPLLSMFH